MLLKIARVAGLFAVIAGLAGFALTAQSAEARGGSSGGNRQEVRVIAELQGVAVAESNGKAVWKSKRGKTEMQIELEDADRIAGEVVHFYLGDQHLGRSTVTPLGDARLKLNHRQAPALVAGMRVTVKLADGTIVAGGAFPS
ncbi:MAG: hypothetical protein ACKVVT_08395 [Dehalococcoidia bacterium]